MKLTLSLIAAIALSACASDKEINDTAEEVHTSMDSNAPKAAKVSLAIEGMT